MGESKASIGQQWFWLSYRYFLITSKDVITLVVMLGQALFIGWLCAVMWGRLQGEGLTLILVMSVLWLGLLGACREVIKERSIFERERLWGGGSAPYLLSKFLVLGGWALFQVIFLMLMIEVKFSLPGHFVPQVFSLWLITLSGIAIGLFISSVAHRQDVAVISVPLLIVPQLLFSSQILPSQAHSDIVSRVKYFMPSYWGETLVNAVQKVPLNWADFSPSVLALFGFILFFMSLALLALDSIRRRLR